MNSRLTQVLVLNLDGRLTSGKHLPISVVWAYVLMNRRFCDVGTALRRLSLFRQVTSERLLPSSCSPISLHPLILLSKTIFVVL